MARKAVSRAVGRWISDRGWKARLSTEWSVKSIDQDVKRTFSTGITYFISSVRKHTIPAVVELVNVLEVGRDLLCPELPLNKSNVVLWDCYVIGRNRLYWEFDLWPTKQALVPWGLGEVWFKSASREFIGKDSGKALPEIIYQLNDNHHEKSWLPWYP